MHQKKFHNVNCRRRPTGEKGLSSHCSDWGMPIACNRCMLAEFVKLVYRFGGVP